MVHRYRIAKLERVAERAAEDQALAAFPMDVLEEAHV
jgi:hypothetical protein